jgi:hypothetical protein
MCHAKNRSRRATARVFESENVNDSANALPNGREVAFTDRTVANNTRKKWQKSGENRLANAPSKR